MLELVQSSLSEEKLMCAYGLAPLSWRRRLAATVSRWSTVFLMLLLVFGSSGPAVAAVGDGAADLPDASDRLTTPQVEAMTEIADSADQLRRMKVVVKRAHKDRMEPLLMGVVRLPGERPVLVDPEGDVYRDGMADFRRDNDLFSQDDDLLYNENWEDETAEVDLVTVSASTAPDPVWWWYAGGGAVAVLALGALAWRLRANRRLAAHYESLREPDADPRPSEAAAGQRATDN